MQRPQPCGAWRVLLPLLVLGLIHGAATGQEAVATRDRKALIAEGPTGELLRIDLASGAATPVPSPPMTNEYVTGLAFSNAGHLLIQGRSKIWAVDLARGKQVVVCPAPADADLFTMAYDSKTASILATVQAKRNKSVESELWILPKNHSKLLPVRNRRAEGFWGLVFLPDGRLVFAARGDLWIGSITEEAREEGPASYALQAERFCPLASWETASGTTDSYGAREIVSLRDRLVVHIGRMGGTGDGSIVTVPIPSGSGGKEPDNSMSSMAKSLAAVRTLGRTGSKAHLGGTPDWTTAWFQLIDRSDEPRLYRLDSVRDAVSTGFTVPYR